VCRVSLGVCDVMETCTGAISSCPSDAFIAAGTVCRASAGTCDLAETCTGSSAACPSDVLTFLQEQFVVLQPEFVTQVTHVHGIAVNCPIDQFSPAWFCM
jgi:Na+-translocating ferredoxin:NAD+ oxidoreductase RNF subunit RnfB